MIKYFDLNYFLFGVLFGILGVIIIPPEYTVVYKTPTPLNLNTIYTDTNGNCYEYEMKTVKCPKNYKRIIS